MKNKKAEKKRIGAAALAMIIAGTNALTVTAAPMQMPDGSVFDPGYYAALYPDVVIGLGTNDPTALYQHYVDHGRAEGRIGAAPGAMPEGEYAAPSAQETETETDMPEFEDQQEEEQPSSTLPGISHPNPGKGNTSQNNKRNALRDKLAEIRSKSSPKGKSVTAEEFYKNSVFVGDSIMLGFRNYSAKRANDPLLSELSFLAAGSFGANNALKPIDKSSVHPVYKGEQRYIWDSIKLMGSSKAFILVGLNDLNVAGLDGSLNKYMEVIGKIKKESPNVQINIISMPYILKGSEKGRLNNNSIREYNEMLKKLAAQNGYGYVDIATVLQDSEGNLEKKYCSDGFLHQTPAAYDEWVKVLRAYAGEIN